ncbi:MAG: hypothetical protein HXY39_03465 [Chloroflexi bacterium]|nr:hypothetical protein [Chloroflexota bacterium]
MSRSRQPERNGRQHRLLRNDAQSVPDREGKPVDAARQRREAQIAARQPAQRRGPVLSRRPLRVPGR